MTSSVTANQGVAPVEGRGAVLVVDDEEALLQIYSKLLAAAGFNVRSASSGGEALRILDEGATFDVIISDIWMPEIDGLGLLKHVREKDADVPVILMTGTPSVETAAKAIEYGVLRYLVKPVDLGMLRQSVEQACWLHRLAKLKRQVLTHLGTSEAELSDRAGLEVRFNRALSQVWVAMQPIVDVKNHAVYGYEALARANDPTMSRPDILFGSAHQLGRLPELGRLLRGKVAAQLPDAPPEANIFVNLHTLELADDELVNPESPLAKHASRVVLEITERAAITEVGGFERRVSDLRKMGYRIAIDDLGAGYSSLSSFAILRPDIVKLDISLVRNVHQDGVRAKLVGAMTRVCQSLGITVVAEGVETRHERDALMELGCDMLQGYLFARPGTGYPPINW